MQAPDEEVESNPSDRFLFATHDGVNVLVLLFVLGLPYADAGMAMVSQLGGLEAQRWAHQGYLALLYSPVALMITPRLYHKRLIKNPNVHIERERRLAFWLDSSFIIVMTLGIGFLAASMVWKTPLF